NALFGIWMIISPWVLNFSSNAAPTWSAVISGIVVLVLGAIRFFTGMSRRPAVRTAA
ncbi:MAG: hypothetical protein E6I84_16060, partial [Chloroflexi bacterium]